ncbi:MAG: methyltransferase domain-containing protein [Nitrososphaeria archaeon]
MLVDITKDNFREIVRQFITDNDKVRSATVWMLDDLSPILTLLRGSKIERILDIGCGFGGLSAVIAKLLGAGEIHGVDIDENVFNEARAKGVICHLVDANSLLPFQDNYFDLITSFGVLEHLTFFDTIIQESHRVLRSAGYLLISVPNLASWVNRIYLLLGKQLRDVEVSKKIFTGGGSFYSTYPLGHIHTVTVKSLIELLQYYGFQIKAIRGGRPYSHRMGLIMRTVDNILSRRPSFARRFFLLAEKV